MSQWLSVLDTPTSLYLNLGQFSMEGLPLLRFYDRDQLNLVMRARCYSWLHKQRDKSGLYNLFTKEDETIAKENVYGVS